MKIEELERLAVAATAHQMNSLFGGLVVPTRMWCSEYQRLLAEFIEQEKAERGGEK